MLDRDVADLYGVQTKEINQAVKNNPKKFRQGYILELTEDESAALRSNFLTIENDGIKTGRYSKYRYKAFTEKGLYMLATILKSDQATETTVAIIETFALVRHMARMMEQLQDAADGKFHLETTGGNTSIGTILDYFGKQGDHGIPFSAVLLISDGRNKTTKTGTYTYSPEDEIIEFSGYLDTAGYCDGETIEINIDDIGDIYLE